MGQCQDKKRMREAIAQRKKEEAIAKLKEEKQAMIESGDIIYKT